MPRNPNKQTDETTTTLPIEDHPINQPKRTRQALHTARIIAFRLSAFMTKYVVLSDAKVTGMFVHNMLDNSLNSETEQFGAWSGFSKYYRSHLQEFAIILKTQSADLEVVETQSDPFIAESFIRRYCDRMTLKFEQSEIKEQGEASQDNEQELDQAKDYQA